ncbi:zinc-binding dehydrogenase [Pyxidicoccus sp. 3LG]
MPQVVEAQRARECPWPELHVAAGAGLPLFRSGALRPVVDAVLPMTELRQGLERMARNDSVGKLVVRWA